MAVNTKNWQELKKPDTLEKRVGANPMLKASFVAEPLERGFGLTLGNALRRVLLSSLQGAAITSVKIENVLHEFSSLAGVREDVTDIVLNIKQIAIRMQGNGPKRLQLSATGPCDVTAGMIAAAGDIEIMNPKHAICHLDQGATLNMELTADIGKGYVAAAANRPADAPIGLIPVDALADAATGRYRDRASPDVMPPAYRLIRLRPARSAVTVRPFRRSNGPIRPANRPIGCLAAARRGPPRQRRIRTCPPTPARSTAIC